MAGQAAQIQNAMNANRLYQSRVAAGQAFQKSIGPNGTPNQNLLLQNLAANPQAAAMAQEAANSGQALANSNFGFNTAQQTALSSIIGSQLTQSDDQQNADAYKQRIMYARQAGLIDDQHVAAALQNMPAPDAGPQAYRQFGTKLLIGSLAGPQVAQQAFGTPIVNNNGQTITGGIQRGTAAGGGLELSGQSVPVNRPTPMDLITPQKMFDPATNTYVTKPLGTVAKEQGLGGLLGAEGENVPNPRQGRYPTAAVQASPALGQEAAAQVTSAESAKQGVSLTQTADAVPTRKSALDDMLSVLQSVNTGPGANWEKTANALSNRLTGFGITMSPKQVADMENFNKVAKQIALAQTQALGVGTDQKLETALGANPNSELSKLGNQQVIGMLKGNEDAIALKNLAWQQWQQTHGSQSYGTFSTQFNQTFDPRALQAVYMDPADKAKLAATLNKDPLAKARFIATLKQGIAAGIIQAPSNGQ